MQRRIHKCVNCKRLTALKNITKQRVYLVFHIVRCWMCSREWRILQSPFQCSVSLASVNNSTCSCSPEWKSVIMSFVRSNFCAEWNGILNKDEIMDPQSSIVNPYDENIGKYFWCSIRVAAEVLKEIFLVIYNTKNTKCGHKPLGQKLFL